MVPGLDRADGVDGGDIGAAEGAVVFDVLDAGTAGRDDAGEFGEAAGAVADDGGEAGEPAVVHETFLNHAAEDGGVDITATGDEDDPLAFQFGQQAGHQGGQGGGGGALNDDFLALHETQDRQRDPVLADLHDAVDPAADKRKGIGADRQGGEAVGQGRPARAQDRPLGLERGRQVAGGGALDANDLDLFPQGFHGHA